MLTINSNFDWKRIETKRLKGEYKKSLLEVKPDDRVKNDDDGLKTMER